VTRIGGPALDTLVTGGSFMPAIGDVARQAQLKIPTIRFYEAEGLLAAPPRSPNGRRQYSEADVRRLTFIRRARELGFELSDVRSLLDLADHPAQPYAEVGAIARRYLDFVQDRIVQLNRLRKDLARVARACAGGRSAGQCNVIEALARSAHCPPGQEQKRVPSEPGEGSRGYSVQHKATGGNTGKVSQARLEPATRPL
jgi:DNA-binding transcriptional MerR regulator